MVCYSHWITCYTASKSHIVAREIAYTFIGHRIFVIPTCKCLFASVSPGGCTCKNFDRDARVIFLGLKFMEMSFFWVSLNWRHFFGFEKLAVIFLGSLKICIIFLGYRIKM